MNKKLVVKRLGINLFWVLGAIAAVVVCSVLLYLGVEDALLIIAIMGWFLLLMSFVVTSVKRWTDWLTAREDQQP